MHVIFAHFFILLTSHKQYNKKKTPQKHVHMWIAKSTSQLIHDPFNILVCKNNTNLSIITIVDSGMLPWSIRFIEILVFASLYTLR